MMSGNGPPQGEPNAPLRVGELPPHLSNSQLNSLLACAHRYYLERILRVDVPQIPAWWFVGGDTVHKLAEKFELRRLGIRS